MDQGVAGAPAGDDLQALSTALSGGALSSVELVRACLSRAAAAQPALHAFTELYTEEALQQARGLDEERARGTVRSALHGIPVALKDAIDVAGHLTACGSLLYEDNRAGADAALVRRLKAAGMVIIGKTQMVEMAFGGWGTNLVMGTPRNPWDLGCHRVPGGSSSASAVALPAGLVPAAIGTDTGGSVRIPAALCGVVGLRTSSGSIPREGVVLLSETLDTVGPMARTAGGAALLHAALGGSLPVPPPRRPRIGILTGHAVDEVEAGVLAGYERSIGHLADLGAKLAEFSFPDTLEDIAERIGVIIAHEGWQAHGRRILQGSRRMDPHVRGRFLAGQRITLAHYRAALQERAAAQALIRRSLQKYDALLTPATPIAAPPLSEVNENALTLSRYTRVVSYFGLCALSLPAAVTPAGLPVGVQLIGPPGTEATLLALARALEARRGPFPAPDLAALGLP